MGGRMSAQVWEVVGGGDKGGIVVREGKETSSAALDRLSTGALVRELALEGERLQYEKLTGTGPLTGWVSLKLGAKDLVVKSDKSTITLKFMNPLVLGQLYCDLMVLEEMTVLQVKLMCAKKSGLKPGSMLPAKGKAGERISESAMFKEDQTIAQVQLEDGDEFAFIYTGDLEKDLIPIDPPEDSD